MLDDESKYKVLAAAQSPRIEDMYTVVPYMVSINRSGKYNMTNVTLTDHIPSGRELLLDKSNNPLVMIVENVESAKSVPVIGESGQDRIDLTKANRVVVKDFDEQVIKANPVRKITMSGKYTVTDVTVAASSWYAQPNDGAATDFSTSGSDKNKLQVKFDSIDTNSYDVYYFGVVTAYKSEYKNSAELKFNDTSAGAEDKSAMWLSSAMSVASYKYGYTKEGYVDGKTNIIGDSNSVQYKVNIITNVKSADLVIGENAFNVTDVIQPAHHDGKEYPGACASLASGGYTKVTTVKGSENPGALKVDTNNATTERDMSVTVFNKEQIKGLNNFEVEFAVRYPGLPYGASAKNTLGVSDVYSVKPLRLDVLKHSDNGEKYPLEGAEFELFYDDSGSSPVKDTKGEPVKIKTDAFGKDSALFVPDMKGSGEITVYLKEKTPPLNHERIAGSIPLTITKNADGSYVMSDGLNPDNVDYEFVI